MTTSEVSRKVVSTCAGLYQDEKLSSSGKSVEAKLLFGVKSFPNFLVRSVFRYATLETVVGFIGLVIVIVYLIGISQVCRKHMLAPNRNDQSIMSPQANEHYLMPFIVLLVVDFSGYIVSETLDHLKGTAKPDRWEQNLFECGLLILLLLTHPVSYQSSWLSSFFFVSLPVFQRFLRSVL